MNQSVVKGEEKLLFIYVHFILMSILYITCESRIEDHKQLSIINRIVDLFKRSPLV
jgi:hypothetical protein